VALMTFRDGTAEVRIEGVMRWLDIGFRGWLASPSATCTVAGESVMQTPDIDRTRPLGTRSPSFRCLVVDESTDRPEAGARNASLGRFAVRIGTVCPEGDARATNPGTPSHDAPPTPSRAT